MSLRQVVLGIAILVASLTMPAGPGAQAAGADNAQATDIFAAIQRDDYVTARRLAVTGGDRFVIRVVDWLDYRRPSTTAGFRALTVFLDANPGWPDAGPIARKAERAAADDPATPAPAIRAWFDGRAPRTGEGALALFRALEATAALAGRENDLVEAWVKLDFEADTEKAYLARFGPLLAARDHVRRLDRLLWEEKVTAARRMLPRVDRDMARLAEARIALAQRLPGVDGAVAR
ncbi:MAG: hypothetical protein FJX53_08735, partial [Alphaproteobacteria bacterium]|nr:hypothetical protein [Alphaproteobacteria bacterium]